MPAGGDGRRRRQSGAAAGGGATRGCVRAAVCANPGGNWTS